MLQPLADIRILLGVTGGIAAYKSADLVRRLREVGATVQVAMTPAATAFVAPLTFQAVSGQPVHTELLDASAEAGKLVTIPHDEPTVMAMLVCATPSPLGWEVLHHLADGYVTLAEEQATEAMRILAAPSGGDPSVVAGESGCTGLAGFLACTANPRARKHLGLDENSRILVFNSEGATDPVIYNRIVGRLPEEVAA